MQGRSSKFIFQKTSNIQKVKEKKMAEIIINSCISGLHKTKVGAHRDVQLIVEEDNSLPHIDPNCMLVKVPLIEDIPTELHSAVSYPKSRNPRDPRQMDQLVRDTAGKKVGNVPSNMCALFRELKRDSHVKEIHCFAIGERPLPSKRPAMLQKFSKQKRRLDRRGGGLVLECNYHLTLYPGVDRLAIISQIRDLISAMDGNESVLESQ